LDTDIFGISVTGASSGAVCFSFGTSADARAWCWSKVLHNEVGDSVGGRHNRKPDDGRFEDSFGFFNLLFVASRDHPDKTAVEHQSQKNYPDKFEDNGNNVADLGFNSRAGRKTGAFARSFKPAKD
jgi:hypothetical protein